MIGEALEMFATVITVTIACSTVPFRGRSWERDAVATRAILQRKLDITNVFVPFTTHFYIVRCIEKTKTILQTHSKIKFKYLVHTGITGKIFLNKMLFCQAKEQRSKKNAT